MMMNPSSRSKCVGLLLSRRFSNLALSTISSTTPSSSSSSTAIATTTTTTNKSFSTLAWKLRNSNSSSSSSSSSIATTPPLTTTAMMMNTNNNHNNTTTTQYQYQQQRTKVSNRKVIDAKNAKRLKIQQKKKKGNGLKTTTATTTATAAVEGEGGEGAGETGTESSTSSSTPFLQHAEWVKFQQSITVDGFQTGQTTTATVLKKSRGGKQARRKREKELARLGGDGLVVDSSLAGGTGQKISAVAAKFPALRYSVEETEELLKLAYATLPTRTGKRGTRNLKRQANRWKIVRKIRSDYKAQLLRAHYRRMLQRKYKRDRTKVAMHDAVDQRQSDLEYQGQVLKRWRNMSHNNNGNSSNSGEFSSSGGDHEIGSGGDLEENKI